MRFACEWEPYAKGMLLEAARLNRDFRLGHFLVENMVAGRSDGILSGLRTRVQDGTLYLEPGLFRLGGLGWLREALPIDLPEPDAWVRLWLYREGDGGNFSLTWLPDKQENGEGLCLCRLHFTSASFLNDSWVVRGKMPENPGQWLDGLRSAGFPQLEFAMGASVATQPTLLPCIQRALAPHEPLGLRLCMLNGLFPLLDHFNSAASWQEALEEMARLLAPEERKDTQTTDPQRVTRIYGR